MGAAYHRGSFRASHPAAPGLNHGSAEIFSLLLSFWAVERINQSSSYARNFANAVSCEGLSKKKNCEAGKKSPGKSQV